MKMLKTVSEIYKITEDKKEQAQHELNLLIEFYDNQLELRDKKIEYLEEEVERLNEQLDEAQKIIRGEKCLKS